MTVAGRRQAPGLRRPTPPPPAPVVTEPDDEPSPLRTALSVLTTLGPPLTVTTALMFYFGWARSDAQARYMGLDVSLFGYSTSDYVLRSVHLLYAPLLVGALFALGWLTLHGRVVLALAEPERRHRLRTVGRVVRATGVGVVAVALVLAVTEPAALPLVVPLAVASGAAAAAYGDWLANAATPADTRPGRPWQAVLRSLVVGGVITLGLFWEVSAYAGHLGRDYAVALAASVPAMPRATVFSPAPLDIQAPGVSEVHLPGATPRYRTTGLRFLVSSGGRIFLLHDGWRPGHGTVIVLPDDGTLRWQFSR